MGTFASGDVSIQFETKEDALKVHAILSNEDVEGKLIDILGEDAMGSYNLYNFNEDVDTEVYFDISSERQQNAEWQIDNVVKLLKHLVKTKEISEVGEFQAELLSQCASWYIESEEFEED